jgi:hypothetical protein
MNKPNQLPVAGLDPWAFSPRACPVGTARSRKKIAGTSPAMGTNPPSGCG